MKISKEELSYADGGWSFISFGWFCPQACSNYTSHLSLAYKEIYDSAVTMLWQLASCPAVHLLPPHSAHYRFHGCVAPFSYNGYSLWPESGRPWEYLNSISDGLWKEGSLLAEIAQGCSSGTLQRKGWRVCGWSPEACQRRRKPVPWWIYSLFQPLQGDWYSLHGVHSTTKRDFTYGNFFSFLHWKQPFLILMKRSERTM